MLNPSMCSARLPLPDLSLPEGEQGLPGSVRVFGQYARLVGELRPSVSLWRTSQLSLDGVNRHCSQETFSALGMTEWDCSFSVGPVSGDRLWIVAYPRGEGRGKSPEGAQGGDEGQMKGQAEEH